MPLRSVSYSTADRQRERCVAAVGPDDLERTVAAPGMRRQVASGVPTGCLPGALPAAGGVRQHLADDRQKAGPRGPGGPRLAAGRIDRRERAGRGDEDGAAAAERRGHDERIAARERSATSTSLRSLDSSSRKYRRDRRRQQPGPLAAAKRRDDRMPVFERIEAELRFARPFRRAAREAAADSPIDQRVVRFGDHAVAEKDRQAAALPHVARESLRFARRSVARRCTGTRSRTGRARFPPGRPR